MFATPQELDEIYKQALNFEDLLQPAEDRANPYKPVNIQLDFSLKVVRQAILFKERITRLLIVDPLKLGVLLQDNNVLLLTKFPVFDILFEINLSKVFLPGSKVEMVVWQEYLFVNNRTQVVVIDLVLKQIRLHHRFLSIPVLDPLYIVPLFFNKGFELLLCDDDRIVMPYKIDLNSKESKKPHLSRTVNVSIELESETGCVKEGGLVKATPAKKLKFRQLDLKKDDQFTKSDQFKQVFLLDGRHLLVKHIQSQFIVIDCNGGPADKGAFNNNRKVRQRPGVLLRGASDSIQEARGGEQTAACGQPLHGGGQRLQLVRRETRRGEGGGGGGPEERRGVLRVCLSDAAACRSTRRRTRSCSTSCTTARTRWP